MTRGDTWYEYHLEWIHYVAARIYKWVQSLHSSHWSHWTVTASTSILALARFTTPCSVEAKLETFAVDVARERLHARRKSGLVVGKFSFCCSVHGHPAIINIDILV